ncbi:MAG: cytoplasmic protein [Anaerolineae bacterium]|nr:cytoplasmic protein [Anaerolineae bacterium]
MKQLFYTISDEIFRQFPGYARGVVLAHDVKNGASSPELVALLREAEESLRARLDLETLNDHPRIKPWREAYRAFGAKPSEFRSSIEAMTRRVLRNDPLPSINALVDIGNVVSLRYLLPTGSHAIDVLTQDIALRHANGDEQFIPFGSQEVEHPLKGEVIFVEGDTVLTRRWTWRQSTHTLTLMETKDVEFNVDALPPFELGEVKAACEAVMGLVEHFCGGRLRYEILSEEHPSLCLTQ